MTIYTQEEVERVVELARENPRGFLKLTNRYCTTVSVGEVERSMQAWGIDPTKGYTRTKRHAKSSNNRTSRSRENISY